MLTTESEARTKRCQQSFGPMYVTPTGGEVHRPTMMAVSVQSGSLAAAFNGPELPTVAAPSHCIGSACMAWRWHWNIVNNRHEHVCAQDGDKLGFCGKAGKP